LALVAAALLLDHLVLENRPGGAGGGAPGSVLPAESGPPVRRSVAVLPLEDRDTPSEDRAFVDGIHQGILSQLARITSLQVISRTSLLGYRNTEKSPRAIGEELGVANMLMGRARRSADAFSIEIRLLAVDTAEPVWSQRYERVLTMDELSAVQGEIARATAAALDAAVTPAEMERIRTTPTQNLRAYEYYLSGNEYLRHPANEYGSRRAAEMYERAVTEDPDFALAWAALGHAYSRMFFFSFGEAPARLTRAEEAVQRALALVPDLPEAHLALAHYRQYGFRDYAGALSELGIAERGVPLSAELYLGRGFIRRRAGQWADAISDFERAAELDPLNVEPHMSLAVTLTYLGGDALAREHLERVLRIAPDAAAHAAIAFLPVRRDGDVSALEATVRSPPMSLGIHRQRMGWTAALYRRDFEAALRHLDAVSEDTVYDEGGRYIPTASSYGVTHRLAGNPELAQRFFERARLGLEEALERNPEDARLHNAFGEVLVGLGAQGAGVGMARHAVALLPTSRDAIQGSEILLDALVRVFAPAGEAAAAAEALDAYLSAPGAWSVDGVLADPRLDPVREDARFRATVEKHRG
jgi:TolB-like protein/cytochrome c-type biogenesis protein CcmH/NrfG